MKYLTDPKTGKQSITLTFLVISFVLFAGFAAATSLGHAEGVGAFSELFYACAALYFGRRVKIGTKSFSDMDEPEMEEPTRYDNEDALTERRAKFNQLMEQMGERQPASIPETPEATGVPQMPAFANMRGFSDEEMQQALAERDRRERNAMLLKGFKQLTQAGVTAAGSNAKIDQSAEDYLLGTVNRPVDDLKMRRDEQMKNTLNKIKIGTQTYEFMNEQRINDPNSPESKFAQDAFIQMREQADQPLSEDEISALRKMSGKQIHRFSPQMQNLLNTIMRQKFQETQRQLDRESREGIASDRTELMKELETGRQKRSDENRGLREKNREDKLDREFRADARNALKDMRATETWKSAEKAANAIDEISPLLEDAHQKGGQSLAMLGPRIAKGIAGEVGVLTERDVTRYVQNPTIVGNIMDTAKKAAEGKLTDVSYDNLKRLLEIVKKESARKRREAIRQEAVLFARRNKIEEAEAMQYLDSQFSEKGFDTVTVESPDGERRTIKRSALDKYLEKGAKVVE